MATKKKSVKKKAASVTKKTTVKKKAVAKKAPTKKAPAKKAPAKKAPAKKIAIKSPAKSAAKSSKSNKKIKVTPEQHHKMICEAAYYISLGRTQDTVNPTEDWLKAEAAIKKICTVDTK